MKKKMKILSIITIVLMLAMSTMCYASLIAPTPTPPSDPGGMNAWVTTILGILQWVGIAVAVGMLIYMGIRFVTKGANGEADFKKSLPGFALGLVLILGATAIINALIKAMPAQ